MTTFLLWGLLSILLLLGFIGCFINKVPGPVAVLLAMIIGKFAMDIPFTWPALIIVAVLVVLSYILSSFVKKSMKKRIAYTRAGLGTTIGSIIGLCIFAALGSTNNVALLIIGAIIGFIGLPFVFAYLLEMSVKESENTVLERAISATTVYLCNTFIKLVIFAYALYCMIFAN